MSSDSIFTAIYQQEINDPSVVLSVLADGQLEVKTYADMDSVYTGWDLEEAIQAIQLIVANITADEVRESFTSWYEHRNRTHTEDRHRRRDERIINRMRETLSLLIMS